MPYPALRPGVLALPQNVSASADTPFLLVVCILLDSPFLLLVLSADTRPPGTQGLCCMLYSGERLSWLFRLRRACFSQNRKVKNTLLFRLQQV
jgi:hypothetical protein